MICNKEKGMCIAGVFGGIDSGVKTGTQNIFLESAYFNPVYIRKTAKRHALNTDASFRFERGVDPDMIIYALKRAALLIKEIAGGKISSDIVDHYPSPINNHIVEMSYKNLTRLVGKKIDTEVVKKILLALEIKITGEKDDILSLEVPAYRVDVTREADIIEEILLSLENDSDVKISSFGTFSVKNKRSRIGRNPKTGVEAPISARNVVTFNCSNILKAKFN
jgi:phenylalanyl-tRNA synthetase beta chain